MDTKYQVLQILNENEGNYVSGEKIAKELGVSRMAISKAVSTLASQGHMIEAVKHKGYRLDGKSDVLSEKTLLDALEDSGIKGFYLPETFSTNMDAKRLAGEGVKAPFLVCTSRQTGGRGRLGRRFESPRGGVYFSLVLDGDKIASSSLVTISAAWAIADVMERLTGIETSIKWVNDVYIRNKKAVGILTEGIVNMEEGGISQVVIGCGINLKTKKEDYSPSLSDIVTSFYPSGESKVQRVTVISECAKAIIKAQTMDFLEEYRKKCFVIGKDIYVVRMDEKKAAKALRIDKDGHLVVRYSDGSVEALSCGEVSIRFDTLHKTI